MAVNLSKRFLSVSKLQSWDFAIGEDGEPILIEVNLSFGQIDFHQMCNGPIWGASTQEMLRYVFDNNPRLNKKYKKDHMSLTEDIIDIGSFASKM